LKGLGESLYDGFWTGLWEGLGEFKKKALWMVFGILVLRNISDNIFF
jgi:hypothetical protein